MCLLKLSALPQNAISEERHKQEGGVAGFQVESDCREDLKVGLSKL